MTKTWWNVLTWLYCKFTAESNSERIFIIVKHFAQLRTRQWCLAFFWLAVYILTTTTTDTRQLPSHLLGPMQCYVDCGDQNDGPGINTTETVYTITRKWYSDSPVTTTPSNKVNKKSTRLYCASACRRNWPTVALPPATVYIIHTPHS